MDTSIATIARAAHLLGVVSQLYTTRMNTLLQAAGLNLSQFALLNHLAQSPKNTHSITELTEAMEMHQPGVTKLVQKLHQEGFLEVQVSKNDARKRKISITEAGREHIIAVGQELFPDVQQWFADWSGEEVQELNRYLNQLAVWLDSHRLS